MKEFDVPVAGGSMRVVEWPGDGPAVFAAHGITANALSWAAVAEALDGRVRLVAPDLRGRGLSAELPGPYGLGAHADDLMVVADYFGQEDVTLVGHSMGAFAVAWAAEAEISRVRKVLLVDGGPPLPLPAGISPDDALNGLLGPAMTRLSMKFPDFAAYADYFRANPALGRYWSSTIESYVRRDFDGHGSRCNLEAVRADSYDEIVAPQPVDGFPLLWAPRGLQDQEPGLYSEADLSGLDAELVPDTNHYTILLGAGARRVADRLVELVRE